MKLAACNCGIPNSTKSLHLQFAFETAAVHEVAFMNESDGESSKADKLLGDGACSSAVYSMRSYLSHTKMDRLNIL